MNCFACTYAHTHVKWLPWEVCWLGCEWMVPAMIASLSCVVDWVGDVAVLAVFWQLNLNRPPIRSTCTLHVQKPCIRVLSKSRTPQTEHNTSSSHCATTVGRALLLWHAQHCYAWLFLQPTPLRHHDLYHTPFLLMRVTQHRNRITSEPKAASTTSPAQDSPQMPPEADQ